MFLVPLFNFERVKKLVLEKFQKPSLISELMLPLNCCPICESAAVEVPYVTNCNHLYCYYCIKTALMADKHYSCKRCGTKVTSIERRQFESKVELPRPFSFENPSAAPFSGLNQKGNARGFSSH